MKSELRRDTRMLHPNFIMCWKRPHFHWAVFEGGLACVLSWDGSVFVLLNSLTPPGPVSSSLTTAAPWVREWRERLRSDGGLNPIPLLAARCIVFEGVACLLWRKMAGDHALCSPGIQSTEKSFLNPKEYLIHNHAPLICFLPRKHSQLALNHIFWPEVFCILKVLEDFLLDIRENVFHVQTV